MGKTKKLIKVVTTFNAKGYEEYGKRLIESFRLWPKGLEFVVYQEGFDVGGKELLDIKWLVDFKERNKNKRFQDFRWDAVRFAHKTAAVIDAAKDADFLVWVDGDVYTHKRITEVDLASWLPGPEEYLSWLWRDKMYPECGFYILRLDHSKHRQIMSEWQRLYESDDIYRLQEWHDSFVFAYLIKRFAVNWKSLSGDYAWHSHPFINGPLGEFMDHCKGPRKAQGRSNHWDLAVKRSEDHWRKE